MTDHPPTSAPRAFVPPAGTYFICPAYRINRNGDEVQNGWDLLLKRPVRIDAEWLARYRTMRDAKAALATFNATR